MSTALTNTPIQNTYGDVLQLGNSGAGITAPVQTVRDGLGNTTALQLSTTTVEAVGTVGFLVPNNAGYPGIPGGYRALQVDGVTAQTLIALASSNNIDLDPLRLSAYTITNSTSGHLVRKGGGYWIESNDISQDLPAVGKDTSNNLHFGAITINAGWNQLADIYFDVFTGKAFHWTVNAVEKLTLTATGQLSIGNATPDASALMQGDSTTQGWLLPRMTTTQRDAISSPAEGLVIYNTTLHKLNVRVAAGWETVTSS